jgi:hypothetical protein
MESLDLIEVPLAPPEPKLKEEDLVMDGTRFSPLDIIFFKGTDFSSKVISEVQKCSFLCSEKKVKKSTSYKLKPEEIYTHVGILVNFELLPSIHQLLPNVWYVLESTVNLSKRDGPKDVVTGDRRFGVQIRELDLLMNQYHGKVYWGKLKNNPYNSDTFSQLSVKRHMNDVYEKYINAKYEVNMIDMCAAAFSCCRGPRNVLNELIIDGHLLLSNFGIKTKITDKNDPNNMVYCSQLVAIILNKLGYLPMTIDTRNYLPTDPFGLRDGYPNIIEKLTQIVKPKTQITFSM